MASSPPHTDSSQTATAIAEAVLELVHEYTGRRPADARTTLHDDLVLVLVRDPLSPAERKLVQGGDESYVVEMRTLLHTTMRDDLVTAVESLTGRGVLAFMATHHVNPDMALEAFVLEPSSQEGTPHCQSRGAVGWGSEPGVYERV